MNVRLFHKVLFSFIILALTPLIVISVYTIHKCQDAIKNEIEKGLILRASEIANRVEQRLEASINDLEYLAQLPPTIEDYKKFAATKRSRIWTRVGRNDGYTDIHVNAPLYREIAWIDPQGQEIIRIENRLEQEQLSNKKYVVTTVTTPSPQLKDVSEPKNTMFKSEDYFLKAKGLKPGEFSIGEVTGWYVTAKSQLHDKTSPEEAIEGARYEGILRFATPVYKDNQFQGVVTIALDQSHLQEIIIHTDALKPEPVLFSPYSSGNYAFLFDDQGWIIAHPKLWNIRGLTPDGAPYHPFKNIEGTNKGPVNLIEGPKNEAHYKLKQLMENIGNKQAGTFDVANLGLDTKTPIIRAQTYAPILFNQGHYQERGVFGGVMVGAKLATVKEMSRELLHGVYGLIMITLILVILFAWLAARSLTQPIERLKAAALQIARGDLDPKPLRQGRDEIGQLASLFNEMSLQLKENLQRLNKSHQNEMELKNQLADREKREKIHLQSRIDQLERKISEQPLMGMVYESHEMKKVVKTTAEIAKTDVTVLILGERGCGKEKIAAAIHSLSPRKDKPYLRVNCAAIAENLIESELFGHARGSFTGAHQNKIGFFEAATNGTLLLDEIGELSLNVQAKLLRVLQEKKITRVGETIEREIQTRLIAATNQDLKILVQSGRFRADLYDRLNIARIEIPTLRERKDDIIPLAQYFLHEASRRYNKNILGFSEEVIDAILKYPWPGNIRELENCIERAVIHAKQDFLNELPLGQTTIESTRNTLTGIDAIPDMTMNDLKEWYTRYLRQKYADQPLKRVKDILNIDWNTLRKFLKGQL